MRNFTTSDAVSGLKAEVTNADTMSKQSKKADDSGDDSDVEFLYAQTSTAVESEPEGSTSNDSGESDAAGADAMPGYAEVNSNINTSDSEPNIGITLTTLADEMRSLKA